MEKRRFSSKQEIKEANSNKKAKRPRSYGATERSDEWSKGREENGKGRDLGKRVKVQSDDVDATQPLPSPDPKHVPKPPDTLIKK